MRRRNPILTADQQAELLQVYLKQGYAAAKPLAVQYGICPRTISSYARAAGIAGKRGRQVGVWKGITGKTDNSARWQKAIERGAVVI